MYQYNPNVLLMSTHPNVKQAAKEQWEAHLKRRPAIDAKMAPLRQKAWEISNMALPDGHPRKNIIPDKLLMGSDLVKKT